jgi:hypothetical protein
MEEWRVYSKEGKEKDVPQRRQRLERRARGDVVMR